MEDRDNPLTSIKPSPRVKLAAQLYASGAMPTKKAASAFAGLHPNYLSMLTAAGNPQVISIIEQVENALRDETVSSSKVVEMLGKRALRNIAMIMEDGHKEENRLRAAIDLADRYPDTAKTQKTQSTSFSIGDDAAQQLAAALVEASRGYRRLSDVSGSDIIKVDSTSAKEIESLNALEVKNEDQLE